MVTLAEQKAIIDLIGKYDALDHFTVRLTFKHFLNLSGFKARHIAQKTNIPVQTIYQLNKANNYYKPDFLTMLIICDALEITITDLIKQARSTDNSEPITAQQHNTKWTITAMQEYLQDFENLTITELCAKYDITPGTAKTYRKEFIRITEAP